MRRLCSDLVLIGKVFITCTAAFGGFGVAVAPHPLAVGIWLACAVASYFIIRSEP